MASVYPNALKVLLPCTAQCTGALGSVDPVPTGYSGHYAPVHPVLLVSSGLVHFDLSSSSFFVFYFSRTFYFILGT